MKRLEKIIEKYLLPVANAISGNNVINAIKDGMLQVMPLIMIGSLMLIIANFPFIEKILPGVDMWGIFGKGYEATMGITALAALITVSYNYAQTLGTSGIYGVMTSLASYLVLTDFFTVVDKKTINGVISTSSFGGQAIITALITAIISVKIYTYLEQKNITIKMPSQVPQNVSKSFSSMIPLGIVVIIMLIIRGLIGMTTFASFQNLIYVLLTKSLMGLVNYKYSIVLISMIGSLLWFFGIHGGIIVLSIFGPIMDSMMIANTEAFTAGNKLPYIATTVFYNTYCVIGAMGILAAVVATMIVGKSKLAKSVTKIAIIPALFNIQEPFHFGFPTFMNPILFIPYVFITPLLTFIAYTLVEIGFAPIPIINVPWTTPIIISGFLATNYNIMGAVTQIVLFALAVVLWIPFIKISDKLNLQKEKEEEI